jgi:hypothetical protein
MKLEPYTVRVKTEPPAVALVGLSELSTGTGLLAGVMVNVCVPEVPPPGVELYTVTEADPDDAMSADVIVACSWPLLR